MRQAWKLSRIFGTGRAEAKASGSRVTRLENVSELVTWMVPTHTSLRTGKTYETFHSSFESAPAHMCEHKHVTHTYEMISCLWICIYMYVYMYVNICVYAYWMYMYINKLFVLEPFDTSSELQSHRCLCQRYAYIYIYTHIHRTDTRDRHLFISF